VTDQDTTQHGEVGYVYIVGPIIGGAVAALTYDRFLAKGKTPG